MIVFRKATPKDSKHVKELLALTCQDSKFENLNLDNCMVAEYDGTIIGVGGLEMYHPVAFLNILSIHPRFQKQGYGDGLVRAIINFADRRSIKKIYVLSDKNTSGFFRKIGFVPMERINYDITCQQCRTMSNPSEKLLEMDIEKFFNTPHCKI